MNGSREAQEILYDKYRKILERFIKSKYPTTLDLEDDVSEIMIRVIMNLTQFDNNKSKFKSWVFSIAKNYMIDKWRKNSFVVSSNTYNFSANSLNLTYTSTGYNAEITENNEFQTITNSGTLSLNPSFSTSFNADFDNCSSVSYLSTQLSPVDFTLLDMKYVQGYDYCEIGKEFNISSTTASNRINYLKTKLKKNNPEEVLSW